MSTLQTRTHQAQGHEAGSLRSRASSVVSTGTKFSISTLPNDEHLQIDSLLDRPRHSIAFRPRSVFSAISYDQSLPPYEPYDETHSGDIVADMPNHNHTELNPELPAAADESQSSPGSPTSDPENALSRHYSRVVRMIDQNHLNQMRRLKEAHQEELGAVRHSIDQTYRKELKAKDHEVEKIREEIESLKATHEAAIASMQREVVEREKRVKRWLALRPRLRRLLLACSEKSSSILRNRFKRTGWPLLRRVTLLKTFGKPVRMAECALPIRRQAKQSFNIRRTLSS
ncbi:MAG: hypothetical protein Q9191_000341 [Dirinaria sp. TL-2023a]